MRDRQRVLNIKDSASLCDDNSGPLIDIWVAGAGPHCTLCYNVFGPHSLLQGPNRDLLVRSGQLCRQLNAGVWKADEVVRDGEYPFTTGESKK